jgi:hypothetical protein
VVGEIPGEVPNPLVVESTFFGEGRDHGGQYPAKWLHKGSPEGSRIEDTPGNEWITAGVTLVDDVSIRI